MVEHRLWAACERVQGLAGGPRLDPLVVAEDLGPGLLDDQHPDFLWPLGCICPGRLRKRPSMSLVIVREVVVDHDSALLPIDVHLHGVAARFVHLIGQENALNAIGVVLGQGAQAGQKVAVSASTLFDVIGPWFGIEDEVSLAVDLSRSLPGETFPALVARLFSHVTVEERCLRSWKVFIFPVSACLDDASVVYGLEACRIHRKLLYWSIAGRIPVNRRLDLHNCLFQTPSHPSRLPDV